jgi:hypothetical protein
VNGLADLPYGTAPVPTGAPEFVAAAESAARSRRAQGRPLTVSAASSAGRSIARDARQTSP